MKEIYLDGTEQDNSKLIVDVELSIKLMLSSFYVYSHYFKQLYGSFGVFPKKYSIIILAKARLGGS